MPLDFPANPSDGQIYGDFYYDAAIGAWQSNAGTQLPNIFKNVSYTTAQTYLVPATIKGKLGQTANLQEWQDSAGTVLAKVESTGKLTTTSDLVVTGNITANSITTTVPIVSVPTGGIMPYAGSTAPNQFLLCQGQAVSRTTYANLFAVLGTAYGSGDGSTTFNIPDLRSRMPVGFDDPAAWSDFRPLGKTGGERTVTLSSTEMPVHSHSIDHNHAAFTSGDDSPDHSHSWSYNYGAVHNPSGGYAIGAATTVYWSTSWGTGGASTRHQHNIDVPNYTGTSGNAGSGGAHNNLQPYLVTNYIIKT